MTVAVRVTGSPWSAGLGLAVSTVVVGAAVWMVTHQPLAIEPVSPVASSNTQRLQVPLAALPLNVDSVVAELSGGAGAGRDSVDSSATRVGL